MERLQLRVDGNLRRKVLEQAKRDRRTLAGEVMYLLERGLAAIEAENCGEAKELSAFIHGCPAAKSIETLTEAQA